MYPMNLSDHQCRSATIGIVCVFMAAGLTSCQYDPWADGFLTRTPAGSDIVGTYKLDADTLARQISAPESKTPLRVSPSAHIVLSANHKAEFFEVPDWIYDHGSSLCVIDGTGSWQLGKNDRYSVLNVKIDRKGFREGVDKCNSIYYGQLFFYGHKAPYKLHITIGDPDSGDAVQLEKAKAN